MSLNFMLLPLRRFVRLFLSKTSMSPFMIGPCKDCFTMASSAIRRRKYLALRKVPVEQ